MSLYPVAYAFSAALAHRWQFGDSLVLGKHVWMYVGDDAGCPASAKEFRLEGNGSAVEIWSTRDIAERIVMGNSAIWRGDAEFIRSETPVRRKIFENSAAGHAAYFVAVRHINSSPVFEWCNGLRTDESMIAYAVLEGFGGKVYACEVPA